MPDILYINGRFTTTAERVLGVEDRGFLFGDALYEVFKFLGRRPAFIDDHYNRLEGGLAAIEIPSPWSEAEFRAVIRELLDRTSFEDGIVYVQISRGEAERAHFWPEDLVPTVIAFSRRYHFPDAAKKERGFRAITTDDVRWKRCDVKSVNLLGNALAKKRAQRAGVDEALLVSDGIVREGASSNLFAVREGRIITHPLDEHILPGTVRDRVIDLAAAASISTELRPLRESELTQLDEAFTTSTTQGVMPMTEINGRAIGNGRRGAITARLQQLFDELERASCRSS